MFPIPTRLACKPISEFFIFVHSSLKGSQSPTLRICRVGNLDSLMASAFGHEMTDEQKQMSEGSSMHVRVTSRTFRNSDLESVCEVNEPEPTHRNQASPQRNVARNTANWRKIDSRLSCKPLSLS